MRSRLLLFLVVPVLLAGQSLKDFEKKVTEFTLANGLHFIIVERHEAPVVSFHTYANVGSVDDPSGESGIAHMFEHMAFKGTQTIGTTNWPEEKKALASIEQLYDRMDAERNKGIHADQSKIEGLQAEIKQAIAKADSFVEPNEYDRIVESNGGVGMNASTAEDSTNYFYSFPSNRLELWFLLESERFIQPVFREFYKERDVVREERRMRVESSPEGKLMEMMLATALRRILIGMMPGGWASDIDNFRRTEAEKFFKIYYAPSNHHDRDRRRCESGRGEAHGRKVFWPVAAQAPPPRVVTVEPRAGRRKACRRGISSATLLGDRLQAPRSVFAWTMPRLDVLSDMLSGGRTGMIYKELVRDKKIALAAESVSTFPGGKYPSLFLFFVIPSSGRSIEENEKAVYDIIERVKKEKVDEETIERVKTKLRAELIRKLDSNSGLAEEMCSYYVAYGDWRKLFTELEDYNKVTAEDVQRVAQSILTEASRTVAYTYAPPAEGGAK